MPYPRPSRLSPALQAVLFGLVVLVLLFALDRIAVRFSLTGALRVLDDIAGALIVGALAFWQARSRNRFVEQRLNTIALMNHHVRNALQVISYSNYLKQDKQVEQVKDAVERIEWALREILPARSLEQDRPRPEAGS
jgi:hypothetical protein